MQTPDALKQPLVFGDMSQIVAIRQMAKDAENNGQGKYKVVIEFHGECEEEVEASSREDAEKIVLRSFSPTLSDMDLDVTATKIKEDSDEE